MANDYGLLRRALNPSPMTSGCWGAGTLLWMLAADTYPDYDGYSIYTTKGPVAAAQPKWPDLDSKLLVEVCAPALTVTGSFCTE